MSKIKEILNDNNSVLVFDVDGVLAIPEFGEYNHYVLTDEEWDKAVDEGKNFYTADKVCHKIQNFLSNKNMDNIYVISTVSSSKEEDFKKDFAHKYYNIQKENVFGVSNNNEKTNKLIEIKEMHPTLEDHQIAMIEDTVIILNDIMRKTNFTTVHISSFLDI